MILQELLDKPYSYELDEIGKTVEATFMDDTGEVVTITLDWWPGADTYIVDFKRRGTWDLTGDTPADKMVALRILSTVVDVLTKAVAKHKVLCIGFSSKNSEPSRVRLYNRLSKRIVAQTGYVRVDDLEKVDNDKFRSWVRNMLKAWSQDVTRIWLIRKDAVLP